MLPGRWHRRHSEDGSSEEGAVAHELGKVYVYDAVALLDGIVEEFHGANCQVKGVNLSK